MREKLAPGVDELTDAAVACFGQGHGDAVSEAMRQVLIGDAIGRITGRAGRTPLQEEFYDHGRAAAAADPGRAEADPGPPGRERRRGRAVGLPAPAAGRWGCRSGGSWRAGWAGRLARGAAGAAWPGARALGAPVDAGRRTAALIERTAWGSTLAEACGRLLRQQLDEARAG